ncbi:ATPase SWSAP1 [Thalassophryne amazonica]|uniref:ATPase SWSAP1 n=1 Tax=Thalassophryne amazonica TaxID=390379 RepID=UPI001470D802|nr:ATPase SWSAP1 [Thalassophryne amazonica]
MADVLTLVFRTFGSRADVKKDLKAVCWSAGSSRALVVGEWSVCGSLLLLAAATAAAHMGSKVMFFTQTQIQSLPVSLQRLFSSLSPDSLKKIKFCYPRTVEELLQQVAALHESAHISPTPPSLIIVDRMEGYLRGPAGGSHTTLHSGEQSCAAHLSALLCDTAAFFSRILEQRGSNLGPCRVIAAFQPESDTGQSSVESSATDPVLDVLDRYFQVRCTLDRDRSYDAVAAGAQEAWHIYLSGTGITEASCSTDKLGSAQEWQVITRQDGFIEFKMSVKDDSSV